MTLGDDHREGANVLLLPPPALLHTSSFSSCPLSCPPSPPFSAPWVPSRFVAPCAPPPLPPAAAPFSPRSSPSSSLPHPRVTLRSSYHNRRHPSCITCHFVPRRILFSPRHDNRARDSAGEPTMTSDGPAEISSGVYPRRIFPYRRFRASRKSSLRRLSDLRYIYILYVRLREKALI